MPKPPLSPFLLDPAAEPPAPEREDGPCSDHAPRPRPRGAMDLGAAELVVVATLRAWVAPHLRPAGTHPDWRELLRLAGAGVPAMVAFDGLMSVIAAKAKRLIDVHCCRCPVLGDDEASMLRLVGALQAGEALPALAILADWLPHDAAGPALHAARRFALAIDDAGLSLPRRGTVVPFPARHTLH